MVFFESLKEGNEDIKINLSNRFNVSNEAVMGVGLIDKESQVYCHISKSPRMLDLNEKYNDLLFSDIDKIAQVDFEAYYKQCSEANSKNLPATERDGWKPVIDVEIIEIGQSKALYVIRRLAYHVFEEIIIGSIVMPTKDYTYEISTTVKAGTTGVRESLLVDKLLSDNKDEADIESLLKQSLPQSEIDKKEHDDLIKEHPLSLTRKQLNWFLSTNGGHLEIKEPYLETCREIELTDINCVVTAPPRYLYSPLFKLIMPSIKLFSRKAINPFASNYELGSLHIYKVPNTLLSGNNIQGKLVKLAKEKLNEWKNEGVEKIKIRVNKLPSPDSLTRIETFTKLEIQGQVSYSLAIWLCASSGEVYRLDCSFVLLSDIEELRNDLSSFVNSWRQIIETTPNEIYEKKRWKFW